MAIVPEDNTDYRKQFESYKLPELIAERQRWNAGSLAHHALTNWIEFREAQNKALALQTSMQALENQVETLRQRQNQFRYTSVVAVVGLALGIVNCVRSCQDSQEQKDAASKAQKAQEKSQLSKQSGKIIDAVQSSGSPAPVLPSSTNARSGEYPKPPVQSPPATQPSK